MSILDQDWFSHIRRPSRYLGNEINAIRKDPTKVKVSIVLAFPDVYEVGMSHLGLKILYHILNRPEWLAAERVFCPWTDLEEEMRRRKIPLTSLESRRPLSEFDILGFSLQHELCFTNVLTMLELSGIPWDAGERTEAHPLVIAGGPSCFNPEPIAWVFDLMVIGDGEEVSLEICKELCRAKEKSPFWKNDLLHRLRSVKGIYIPSFFHVEYGKEGAVNTVIPSAEGYSRVEKTTVRDIDNHPYPEQQVVPFTELVHDRLCIEISRGCTRGCRFCQAGMIYRPVRERPLDSVLKIAMNSLRYTGYEDISLLSLSSGDYGCIEPLLKSLMDKQSRENVSVSFPSLRADTINMFWMEQITRVRKTGFTLAPEAGNERLRKIINKDLSQKDLFQIAHMIYDAGWNMIKLYFMIGLPGETEEDLEDIISLSKEIASIPGKKGKRPKLNISLSTFVPKAHTPFQWVAQIPLEESRRRIQFIQDNLKAAPVRVKWNQPEMSWLEGIFSRGDRRLGRVVARAWDLGARFDAWGEEFQREIWQEAFRNAEVDPDFYLSRARSLNELLPWDHISPGIDKEYLKREWSKAQKGELTEDCRKKCHDCGVCDHRTLTPVLYAEKGNRSSNLELGAETTLQGSQMKYRLIFEKLGYAKYLSHLELVRLLVRALRRVKTPLVYSGGYHPMPKVSFASALPVGVESMQETMDMEVHWALDTGSFKRELNLQLPEGIKINQVMEIPFRQKAPQVKEASFLGITKKPCLDPGSVDAFLNSTYFPIPKATKKGQVEVNARAILRSIRLLSSSSVKMVISYGQGPSLKPDTIIKEIFSLDNSHLEGLKLLKTQEVLNDDPLTRIR